MTAFATEVPLRWADMDVFGHVNHARTVTLLEEARIEMLVGEAGKHGLNRMSEGVLVAQLTVGYRATVDYEPRSTLQIHISVRELKAASFVLDYSAFTRGSELAATAETLMIPYDLSAARPRRLTDDEKTFLSQWQPAPAA